MKKNRRPFTPADDQIIRELWPTRTKDREIAERLGRHKGSFHRYARERLGLQPRNFARRAGR